MTKADYDRVHLSIYEAALYLGLSVNAARALLRARSIRWKEITPRLLDHVMGWDRGGITQPPPQLRHPDILLPSTRDIVTEPPPTVLDSNPKPRLSIHGYTPAEPFGTADGSASAKYRRPKPSRSAHRATAQGQQEPSLARKPAAQRQVAGRTQPRAS